MLEVTNSLDAKTPPWYVGLLQQLGLPTAILCVMIYGLWTGFSWFGNEIAIPMFQRQMRFIDSVEDSVKEIRAASVVTAKLQGEFLKAVQENAISIKENSGSIREIQSILKKVNDIKQ